MRPTKNNMTNAVLGAPAGWDEQANGKCVGLPISQAHGTMFSYWRPTFAERLRILFGGHVRLGVFGNSHPPVSVDTLN